MNVAAAVAAAALMYTLGLMSPTATASAKPVQDDLPVVAAAREIVDSYRDLGWFSGSVLLATGGKPIFQAAVGLADIESATPNSLDTKYNLGSIMKDFTAVLVLQQIERGVIGLDDDLGSFDLGFPAEIARKITVRHLLDHRSGFRGAFPSLYRESPLSFGTVTDKLALLRDAQLLFEPGTQRRYSNYGYVVLGAILEKATGKSFASLLQKNIFDRLSMEDSVYPYQKDAPNQALRYSFNYDKQQVLVGVTEHHGPDGGIESTVADVLAFYRALFYGSELISQKTGAISEHFAKTGDSWASFGGGTGISAAVQLDLKNDYQVIVLANTDRLVAEEISGRIYSYIQTGTYDPVVLPPVAFAWEMYVEMGQDTFASDFLESYQSAGYSQFVGRTLNELGMSLVNDAMWQDAFIVFGALIELFPEAPQAYDSLAYAHFRSGNSGLARDTFSMALKLQPEFASDYSSDNYGTPAQYPLLDGRCDEYRPIGAEVIAESDELAVLFFQDEDYVWLCYTLPDRSYGTLDLVVDSPALAGPVNLHVSAQLGEWQVDQPDERPGVADSDRWWNVNGWWSNAVAWNGMRETDQATRPNFQASHGRELQMSKTRFGRGTWRLSFSIDSVRDANAGMKRVVLPPEGKAPIVVEVF